MNLIARLEIVADTYCAAAKLRREQVSYRVFSDQRRFDSVFSGAAGLTVANFEKAMRWFSVHWPAGLDWPAGIERPAPDASPGMPDGIESGAAA